MNSIADLTIDRRWRYDEPRLAADAGFSDAPILALGLSVPLPSDTIVRCHRVVRYNGDQYCEWSPNADALPYNPGMQPATMVNTWPAPPADVRARRVDGSLGRFDYARFPQYGERNLWASAIQCEDETEDLPLPELRPIYRLWSCEADADHGHYPPSIINALRQSRAQVLLRSQAEHDALKAMPRSRATATLCRDVPRVSGSPTEDDLLRCHSFSAAVDQGTHYSRVSLALDAFAVFGADVRADSCVDSFDLRECPPAAKHAKRLGRWVNGLHQNWTAFLIRNGYPVFINHRYALSGYYDETELEVRSNWLSMPLRDVERISEWNEFAAAANAEVTTPSVAYDMPPAVLTDDWLRANADPSSYEFTLPGEEAQPRRLPEAATRLSIVPPSATHGPSADPAVPGYSTVPPGETAQIEDDYETVHYDPPVWRPDWYRIELVELDAEHFPWVRPPAVQALAPRRGFATKGLTRWIISSVTINGQSRVVAREVGRHNTTYREGYVFVDRQNRRMLIFRGEPMPTPGVVDEPRMGRPGPNIPFYRMVDNAGRARQTHPTVWMYAADSRHTEGRSAPVGTTAQTPSVSELPLRSEVPRNPYTSNPLDSLVDEVMRDNDDDEEDGSNDYVSFVHAARNDEEYIEFLRENATPPPSFPDATAATAVDSPVAPAPPPPEDVVMAGPPPSGPRTPPLPDDWRPNSPRSASAPPRSGWAGGATEASQGSWGGSDPSSWGASTGDDGWGGSSTTTRDSSLPSAAGDSEMSGPDSHSGAASTSAVSSPALAREDTRRHLAVRRLRRWVTPRDVLQALNALVDRASAQSFAVVGVLLLPHGAIGANGLHLMYDVYVSFDSVRGADAARTLMGAQWLIPARGTLSRRAEDRTFRVPRIDRLDDIDLGIVEQAALAERMPWQELFNRSAAVRDRRAPGPPPPPAASASSSSTSASAPADAHGGRNAWRSNAQRDYGNSWRRDSSPPSRGPPPARSSLPTPPAQGPSAPPLAPPGRLDDYARVIEQDGQMYIRLDDVLRGRLPGLRDASPPPRGGSSATSSPARRSLADRLSDPDARSDRRGKQQRRRQRPYEPYDPVPGPSRRRDRSPPPPPSAAFAART
ncbi:hypothetical protein BD626DRAFT_566923 [Schizophyllum amplum]|uniref:Uncharacterized protein n=1 Tax=Schizophyllum amplum TaxID=97359 RepID=A0A550CNB5_9AGAR|nr:hypothetical protein BD626DRAFT_566923 [Auriculariopsis ampla]